MEWIILGILALAWLISPILLLIALVVARRQSRELRRQLFRRNVLPATDETAFIPLTPTLGGSHRCAPIDLENLVLLWLELRRWRELEALSETRFQQLTDHLDQLWTQHLRESGIQQENSVWRHRRAAAWHLLAQKSNAPLGSPPWLLVAPEPALPPAAESASPAHSADTTLNHSNLVPAHSNVPAESVIAAPFINLEESKTTATALQQSAPHLKPEEVPFSNTTDGWRPAIPNPLEKALHTLSGWPKLIAPFLAQNIGWFIGGFCFMAGALFLIANTSGFVNALVVFTSLSSTTAFLIWAGYQFRHHRPELIVASSVLLTLGMLLAPLDLAIAVQLTTAADEGFLLLVSLCVGIATLAAFAWIAFLVSGLMDRALMGRYPWLLTALAAVQLATPLAAAIPDWRSLVALHLMLLGLLGYALRIFTREWLRRLFVDERLTTYYAASLLVYTALVSFVHLTWIWPEPLPIGYAGPFLMALCGLLFTVDAALKEWVNKYTFLSRFSFALYGLSAVAIAIAMQTTLTIIITLALGTLLYGWVTWRYRTLPPLYLLLACIAGLYGFGLLSTLPTAWRGLASQPGLFVLLGLCWWIGSRSRAIALQCLIIFGVLLISSTAWSVWWAGPGWLAFTTVALAALLSYSAVRLAFTLPDAHPRWAYGDGAVVTFALAAIVYAPNGLPLHWTTQTAFAMQALAALWIGLGLHNDRLSSTSRTVFIAGALLNIALALALALRGIAIGIMALAPWESIAVVILAGALLLWISLALRQQELFYGVLACAGGAGVLIKQSYLPGPSTGLGELMLVPALWWLLWRLTWRSRLGAALCIDIAPAPENGLAVRTLSDLVRAPLEQTMVLLWAIGLTHLGLRLLENHLAGHVLLTLALAIVSGLLLIGYFHRFRWVALPMLLGLAGLLVELDRIELSAPWLSTAAVFYALLIWRGAIALLAKPLTWRVAQALGFTTPSGASGVQQIEQSLHGCALLIATATVAICLTLTLFGTPTPRIWPALILSLLLFGLTGWHYRSSPHAYAALITLVIGAWWTDLYWSPDTLPGLGQPLLNVSLSLGMALTAIALAAERAAPLAYWRIPLYRISGLLYLLALTAAALALQTTEPRLPGLLALLCITLFPVTQPLKNGAKWRGLGLAVLLGGLAWSGSAAWVSLERWNVAAVATVWGYVLWFGGNLLLPRWNARWPHWTVSATFWPLLGLFGVLAGTAFGLMFETFSPAAASAGLSLYLFLLLRNTAQPYIAWLAVITLAASGWLTAANWHEPFAETAALVWLNLLFLLIPLWRRYGLSLAQWLCWRQTELQAPLFWTPFIVLILLLTQRLILEFSLLWIWVPANHDSWSLTGSTLLLAATAAHACQRRLGPLSAQVLLLALGATAVAILLHWTTPPNWLPLAMAMWNGALLLVWRYGSHQSELWQAVLHPWLTLLPAVCIALLLVMPGFNGTAITITLSVLAAVTLAQGVWQKQPLWLKAGFLLTLTSSYAAWSAGATMFTWVFFIRIAPWYAAQTIVLFLALSVIQKRLTAWRNAVNAEADADRLNGWYEVEIVIAELTPIGWLLSGLWLALHGYAVLVYQAGWGTPPWHFSVTADALAASAALLTLIGWALTQTWRRPDEPYRIYITALLLGTLAGYGRLIIWGLTPWRVSDTTALIAAGYAAFLLYQLTSAKPLRRLVLFLPLLALATAPWQLASPWTSGTLLAMAVLYLSLASALHNPLPLYLGVLALNGAIYLWAPLWAVRYELWQLLIVPAAASVLVLLHLHRRELRPKVLNGARLAALSALYAGSGLDAFLRPELGIFVLALGLSFTGILIGIALRIRAFLYTGIAFLMLNIAGQLLRLYPDQGLSRALILLSLGAVITLSMVIFNLKREAILQRIRLVRADLSAWE